MIKQEPLIIKIIIAGNNGVGKTCLIHRFIDGRFDAGTKATLGVDFSLKKVTISNPKHKYLIDLHLWDIAGEDRFKEILPYYLSGTNGIMLVFDITNPLSLNVLNLWIKVVKNHLTEDIPIILISSKHDLTSEISMDDIQIFMQTHSIHTYLPACSLDGYGVTIAFQKLAKLIIKNKGLIGLTFNKNLK